MFILFGNQYFVPKLKFSYALCSFLLIISHQQNGGETIPYIFSMCLDSSVIINISIILWDYTLDGGSVQTFTRKDKPFVCG